MKNSKTEDVQRRHDRNFVQHTSPHYVQRRAVKSCCLLLFQSCHGNGRSPARGCHGEVEMFTRCSRYISIVFQHHLNIHADILVVKPINESINQSIDRSTVTFCSRSTPSSLFMFVFLHEFLNLDCLRIIQVYTLNLSITAVHQTLYLIEIIRFINILLFINIQKNPIPSLLQISSKAD